MSVLSRASDSELIVWTWQRKEEMLELPRVIWLLIPVSELEALCPMQMLLVSEDILSPA